MQKNEQNKKVSDLKQWMINPMERPYPFFKRFMSLPEASFYTSQAESTIKRAVYDGELPVIQRGDSKLFKKRSASPVQEAMVGC